MLVTTTLVGLYKCACFSVCLSVCVLYVRVALYSAMFKPGIEPASFCCVPFTLLQSTHYHCYSHCFSAEGSGCICYCLRTYALYPHALRVATNICTTVFSFC